jgi:hypothetical protein
MDEKAKPTPIIFSKMDEIAKFGWKFYISMDVKNFLSKILMNVEICEKKKTLVHLI